jgi:hypothetical protein
MPGVEDTVVVRSIVDFRRRDRQVAQRTRIVGLRVSRVQAGS